MGQGASPEVKENMRARNLRMAHRIARSTHGSEGQTVATRFTYRHPRAWLGQARGKEPTVHGARVEGSQCEAERLSTRSNTWKCDSARVQTPVGRPKHAYLAKDPV
jgi:hypothetical protein